MVAVRTLLDSTWALISRHWMASLLRPFNESTADASHKKSACQILFFCCTEFNFEPQKHTMILHMAWYRIIFIIDLHWQSLGWVSNAAQLLYVSIRNSSSNGLKFSVSAYWADCWLKFPPFSTTASSARCFNCIDAFLLVDCYVGLKVSILVMRPSFK